MHVCPLRRTYAPQDGRGRKGDVSQAQAMGELRAVVEALQPDGFTPKIVNQTDDFLYVEYTSPLLGVGHRQIH